MNKVELNQGEIKLNFSSPTPGKLSFTDLGIKQEASNLEGGVLRLVFDLEGIGEHSYYQIPTIELAYEENMKETHWSCEFNGKKILEKLDHQGHSTVLLLNRKVIKDLEQHHENTLVIHAQFPQSAKLNLEQSFIHLFK